jgi:Choline dehydrogenase and related flavoproteins
LAKPGDIKPREPRSVKGVSRKDTDDARPVLRADGILSPPTMDPAPGNQYEYIVVGSGAGGGTLAARLAEKGRRVLLLEAGGDAHELQGGDPLGPDSPRLPDDYDVPAFHTLASENDALSWRFFVQHRPGGLDQLDPNYTGASATATSTASSTARRHAGRMHRAQRHDLRLPA